VNPGIDKLAPRSGIDRLSLLSRPGLSAWRPHASANAAHLPGGDRPDRLRRSHVYMIINLAMGSKNFEGVGFIDGQSPVTIEIDPISAYQIDEH
jgi:hypothetical protein